MDPAYVAALAGLVGAAIGSASSIATMVIQSRYRDKRDRVKQVTDLALAEYKAHLEIALAGKGPSHVLPLGAYAHNNDLVLQALEKGNLTPAKWREITAFNDQMFEVIHEIDEERQAQVARKKN